MGKFSEPKGTQNPKKSKKPFYKRAWFWIGVVLFAIFLFGGNSGDQSSAPTVTEPDKIVSESSPDVTEGATLPFDVTFFNDFRNDVTGRWRKSLIATGSQPEDYALDYYRQYFQADDEVHVIYNFSLNTVNTLTVIGNILNVSITEYVKGEEHDAKKACGGLYYGTLQIDTNTGELLYSSFDK